MRVKKSCLSLNYRNMNISNVFNQFCNDLQNRTRIMTEDNIRYYWFASMLQQDNLLDNYTLEQPYAAFPLNIATFSKKELDLLYDDQLYNEFYCFEMKFDRGPKRTTAAKTSAAGELFNDLQRLQQIPSTINGKTTHRLFLYVTDDIMNNYFISGRQRNKSFGRQLNDFYNAQVDNPINLNLAGAPKTFLGSANKSLNNQNLFVFPNLQLIHSRDFTCGSPSFNGGCHVRLYEIY